MMGDSSKLLTHYHDDATTLYEVFQRGLHISGQCNTQTLLFNQFQHASSIKMPVQCFDVASSNRKSPSWRYSDCTENLYVTIQPEYSHTK